MFYKEVRALKIFALSFLFILSFSPLSSAEKKKSSAKSSSSKSISIPIPATVSRTRSYFSNISPRVLSLIEDGSPKSLKAAASLMHRSLSENYSETERILLTDCARIMNIAWQSVPSTWETFSIDSSDGYTNTLNYVERGVFNAGATGAANEDFLTLVLPCLVLLTNESKTSYYAEAERSLKRAFEIKNDSTLANYLMGVLKMRQRKYADSLVYFDNAIKFGGETKETLLAKEYAFSKRGDYENLKTLGEKLLALYPNDIQIVKYCCDAYFGLKNYDKAEELAAKIIIAEPQSFDYILLRAKIFMAKADYVKASSLLDTYTHGGGVAKDYFLLRARLQKEWNKNNSAAAETMTKALTLYPNDKQILLYSAQVASDANIAIANCTALELAEKLLAKDASNLGALKICITERIKLSDNKEAYSLSSRAIKVDSTDLSLLYNHVDICLSLRKTDEAWQIVKDLYAKKDSDTQTQQVYLKVLVASGRTTEASKLITSLMSSADSKMKSFLYYQQSFLYGDESSTLDSLRQSLTANPRNKDALYRLYQVYYNKKDWKRAQYYLKQVVALNPVDANAIAKNNELDKLIQN